MEWKRCQNYMRQMLIGQSGQGWSPDVGYSMMEIRRNGGSFNWSFCFAFRALMSTFFFHFMQIWITWKLYNILNLTNIREHTGSSWTPSFGPSAFESRSVWVPCNCSALCSNVASSRPRTGSSPRQRCRACRRRVGQRCLWAPEQNGGHSYLNMSNLSDFIRA